jgi:hypothetical protein
MVASGVMERIQIFLGRILRLFSHKNYRKLKKFFKKWGLPTPLP